MNSPLNSNDSGLQLGRRQLIAGAAAFGLAGLGAGPAMAQGQPKKGGTLRLGMEGGSASDSLDPRTYADSIPISYSLMFWNQLVEIDAKGNATPELAESWESKPGAAEWVFNIRKGITFGSGKALDADAAFAVGLVTANPDDIDWADEVRIAIEERVSMSPDSLTGLEANLRFNGKETMATRVFGRLTAWQNWIFQRPNAVGEKGALKVYGKGDKAQFDWNRV